MFMFLVKETPPVLYFNLQLELSVKVESFESTYQIIPDLRF